MRKLNSKAQSLIFYAFLIAVLVAALLAMRTSIRYSIQGKMRQAADVFGQGEQYALDSTAAQYDQNLPPVGRVNMTLTSPRFENNGFIPKRFTCEGKDLNPPLIIGDIPKDTKSLVLIVDDPDAPMGTWVHWVVFDISPSLSRIDANSIPGKQGVNDFGMNNYGGPCPPPGAVHHYSFKIYALDTMLGLDETVMVTKAEVKKAMQGHILDKTELVGLYQSG